MARKSLGYFVASAMLLCAAPAVAMDVVSVRPADALGANDDASKAASNLDEIICRDQPPPTGTRTGGFRECETLRYWNGIPHHVRQMLLYGGG
jgi:hypothetical protein